MKVQRPRRASFVRFVLAAVLTATAAVGMLYLFEIGSLPSVQVQRYAYLTAVGVAAGLFTRLVLAKYTGVLRFMTALFSVIAALWAADWVSGGFIGIALIDPVALYENVESLLEFDIEAVTLANMLVLGVPWLTSLLGLRAWKRKPKAEPLFPEEFIPLPDPEPVPAPTPSRVSIGTLRTAPRPQDNLGNGLANAFETVKGWSGQARDWVGKAATPRPVLNVSGRTASEPMVISAPAPPPAVVVGSPARKVRTPKRKSKQKQKHDDSVKFVGAEEHTCPFCLEAVDLNDPRGVEICPICKAYHHKDCWDVTGMCQVPHHQGALH